MTAALPSVDPVEVRRALELLHPPGETFETRVLRAKDATWNGHRDTRTYPTAFGYFRDPGRAAQELSRALGSASFLGIYTTLNPVRPELFSRAADALQPCGPKDSTTSDADVPRRRWLLVDLDFKRPAGISTADAEHEAALALARHIAQEMATRHGWPSPVLADSGNGAHLLWQVSLPGDDGGLVKRVLARLQKDFAADGVDVDQSVFNPARITKLYGTLAAKGSNTQERPHRMSRILEIPEDLRPVPSVLLEDYAPPAEQAPSSHPEAPTDGLDLEALIRKRWPDAKKKTTADGSTIYELPECPWEPEHRGSAFAGRRANGALFAGCHGNRCQGKGWEDFKQAIGTTKTHSPATPSAGRPELLRLSDVQPETISWLWKDRIPRGKLTLLDGDPGLGKSTLSLNIAAAVSTGASLPDGDRIEPADVVILSAEDGAADTIRPRVDAAQGDARRIHLLTSIQTAGGEEETPDLGNHVPMIRLAVDRTRAALVIIDPLMAYLGPDTNSHRDQDVRRTLAPLSRMAEETGCAVLVVRHLNKTNGGPALYRGGGSIGISGAARVALLVAKDPEDDERRVLAVVKNNLAPHAPALGFRLASVGHVARVEWDGEPANYTADELLSVSFQDPEEKTAKESAADFLRALLANGPVPAKQVKKDAAENGLSWKTMCRAKKELEIVSEKKGYAKDTEWTWRLPAWQGVTSLRDEPSGGGRSPEDGQKTSKVPTKKSDHLRDSLATFEGARVPERGVTSDDFEPEEEAV